MNYWWVNHKQTFRKEVDHGFIWSPKTKKDGSANQTYKNLTLVKPQDVIFSYAFAEIRAVGIVSSSYKDSPNPKVFGETGKQWSKEGYLVTVDWIEFERPFKPKTQIDAISLLLPTKYSPIKSDGNGNEGVYLAHINKELGKLIMSNINLLNPSLEAQTSETEIIVKDNLQVLEIIKDEDIPETQKKQLVDARVGQGKFRKNVESIESKCRLTGITNKLFLVASHIKPWRESSNKERLDGHNGFLLSPHADKLFDSGWISFEETGKIVLGSEKVIEIMKIWGLEKDRQVGCFSDRQNEYLKYHRESILKK